MIYGIILAGGKSSRMGQNKMLLLYKGMPFISYAIEGMQKHVDQVIVVTGKYDKEIRNALKGTKVKIVHNPDYEKGMFSSVLTGVKEVEGDFFVLPGDCPFVSDETYIALLNGKGDLRVPRVGDKEGHPLFVSYRYKQDLLNCSLDFNLKSFRDSKKYEIIDVRDDNIVMNLNTVLDVINIQTERKR